MGHYGRSKDKLSSDVLKWILAYGRASVGGPTGTYIKLFCTDRGCSLEDLPEVDDWVEFRARARERKREEKSVLVAWLDDNDDII